MVLTLLLVLCSQPVVTLQQGEDMLKRESVPNGNVVYDITFRRKNSSLRLGKKIYEFYTAPITKFWAHTVSEQSFVINSVINVES